MALANYGDLKTAVASWLGRADLTSVVPDFITVAHTRLMRDLRGHLRQQVRNTTFAINNGSEYVAAPSDFLELVSAFLNANPRRVLQYASPDQATSFYPDSTTGSAGTPKFITLVGSTGGVEYFRFAPVPDSNYTATIEYYGKLAAMSANGDVNWILTDYPELYLYGSLVAASAYVQDTAKAAGYAAAYSDALELAKTAGRRARWGMPNLQVRPG